MGNLKAKLGVAAFSLAFMGSAYADDEMSKKAVEHEFITDRIVRLNDGVTDDTALDVIRKLKYLDANNPKKQDITLIVNSSGGSLIAALAIYDTMKGLKSPVKTICEGRAYSAGAFLVAAGAPGKRFAQPNCRMMFHQMSAGTNGKFSDMNVYHSELAALEVRYYDVMSRSLNRRPEDLKKGLVQDYYIDSQKAQEFGAVDEILPSAQPVSPVGVRPFTP